MEATGLFLSFLFPRGNGIALSVTQKARVTWTEKPAPTAGIKWLLRTREFEKGGTDFGVAFLFFNFMRIMIRANFV